MWFRESSRRDKFDGEDLFLPEGKISELQIARSSQDLLKKIDEKVEIKNTTIKPATAVCDMHSVLTDSLTLSLYNGEGLYNFAGIVNEQVVFGSFSIADKIKNEDMVRIVVSRRGDARYVHSMLRITDDLLLLPITVFCGDKAFFRSCMKLPGGSAS